MTLRSPEGSGIKGGKVEYHASRMLDWIESALTERGSIAEMAIKMAVEHARLAARAALNGMYHGRRPE